MLGLDKAGLIDENKFSFAMSRDATPFVDIGKPTDSAMANAADAQ